MNELKEWIDFIDTECEIEFTYLDEEYIIKSFNEKRCVLKNKILISDYYDNEEILEKFKLDNKSLRTLIEKNEIKILAIS